MFVEVSYPCFYWIFLYHLYEFFTYSKYESFVICISSISPPLTSSDEQILRLMLFNLSMANLSCFLLLKSFLTPVKCRCSFMLSLVSDVGEESRYSPHTYLFASIAFTLKNILSPLPSSHKSSFSLAFLFYFISLFVYPLYQFHTVLITVAYIRS